MRKMVLAGIFALSASTSLAQTGTAPAPAAPAAETATPAAPQAATPTDAAAAPQAIAGGPANLCQELVAFMKAPPPEAVAPAPAAKPAAAAPAQAAPAQQGASAQPAPAQQADPAGQGSSALAGTAGSGEAATAKPESGTNSAQAVTGQDGVATDAPKPSNENVAAGSVANAPQKDSRSAPLPPADVTSTPKESVITVEKAEELATANDIAVCQDMARRMRVAGVSMPPPLIALAALDLQYQQKPGAVTAPAGAEPAATGQDPASQTPAPQ
ncbi:MAG: hypothetical protein H0T56_12700 [Pseudaminobacter sp.]|nr:hypothetical protein [Pseudaminobacter sp.]